jgi:hypothetical protein
LRKNNSGKLLKRKYLQTKLDQLEIFETNGAFRFGGRMFAVEMFHQTLGVRVNAGANVARNDVDARVTLFEMVFEAGQAVQRLHAIFALVHRICQFVDRLVFGQSFVAGELLVAIAE